MIVAGIIALVGVILAGQAFRNVSMKSDYSLDREALRLIAGCLIFTFAGVYLVYHII